MVLAVSDSDVLIHLSKLNKLEVLLEQFSRIYISDIIYNETVIQGTAIHKKDAFILKDFIPKGLISVENEKIVDVMRKHNIHEGESSIIVLAKEFKVYYCLANETKVRSVMQSEGLQVVGTLGILLKAYNSIH